MPEQPPTPTPVASNSVLELDTAKLRSNISVLMDASRPSKMIGVVKANAYGHGVIVVAQQLIDAGVHMLAVATVAEGAELRNAGFACPILVMAAPVEEMIDGYLDYDLDPTISSLESAGFVCGRAASASRTVRCHVKVDTGMGRIGCKPDELPNILSLIERTPGVEIESVWTHLARSTDADGNYSAEQLQKLQDSVDDATITQHVASSYALVTSRPSVELPSPESWTRIGIALYGMMDQRNYSDQLDLQPILRWTSKLTHIKTVDEGTPISYGGRWVAPEPTVVGTVSAGYADGYKRMMSGKAEVGIAGRRYPVVGTICMDMFMVDLGRPGDDHTFNTGDEVVLMGEGGPSVFELADWAGTISYEITTGITARVQRTIK